MGHNFDIILLGNGWLSSKLNKTYVVWSISVVNSLRMGVFLFIDGPALVCEWVNFPILWPHTPVQTKLKCPPPPGGTSAIMDQTACWPLLLCCEDIESRSISKWKVIQVYLVTL